MSATPPTVLAIDGLSIGFDGDDGHTTIVDDVSFTLRRGETLALVGESGCGKSLTALGVLDLLPAFGRISGGSIRLHDQELVGRGEKFLRTIRGNRVSMIFQEPMSALNPVFNIGSQVAESLRLHRGLSKSRALSAAIETLAAVGIPDPATRANDYPHQLSGGMRQRVLIAIALACEPDVLIADEPTTALDVTIQAQILDLMFDLQERLGTAILFISHDFGVVSRMADAIAVMYAGRVVELAASNALISTPRHPYTRGLLATTPRMDVSVPRLPSIAGRVPAPNDRPEGCAFRARCPIAADVCAARRPELRASTPGHLSACHEVD